MSEEAKTAIPLVAKPENRWLPYGAATFLLLLAIWLFVTLETARRGDEVNSQPQVQPMLDLTGGHPIPELQMPIPTREAEASVMSVAAPVRAAPVIVRPDPEIRTLPASQPTNATPPPSYAPPPYEDFQPVRSEPIEQAPTAQRVLAGRIANPEYTIVQGTLINAVLETALDSTRAGQARALVTKDVMAFDGQRVLIPRGSRIFGTYESDASPGQKRVLIEWARLLTPSGISVNLNSPSADPLGRAGLRGKVDNHTFRRLGDAILGSVVELGSIVLGQELGSPPVVILPGAGQIAPHNGGQIQPTIKVEQGTRVTVFVAVDLDFSLVAES